MDANSSIPSSKKRKVSKGKGLDVGSSSSIDCLPEAVLRHVLSFLGTKEAVRTSVLSKRWEYLWTSIPTLEFEEEEGSATDDSKRKIFMNFVDRMLILHDKSSIKRFDLHCSVLDDGCRIKTWITAAVRHNTEKLCLNLINVSQPFVLPHCLFTPEIRYLHLRMDTALYIPSSACFSNLKVLFLSYVSFVDEHATNQLFCVPNLEELHIHDCFWGNLDAVYISAPKLVWLSIAEHDPEDFSDIDKHECQITIFGRNMESFFYTGHLSNDYSIYDSSSIVEAGIDVNFSFDNARKCAYRINKLLRGLPNVKQFYPSVGVVKTLSYAEELLGHMPVFSNLTRLLLLWGSINFKWKSLLKILQNSPHLESLELEDNLDLSLEDDDGILNPVPPCFGTHLKSITLKRYHGTEAELRVLQKLLMNATVLDSMVIHLSKDFTGLKYTKVRELLALPRRSKTCKLEIK